MLSHPHSTPHFSFRVFAPMLPMILMLTLFRIFSTHPPSLSSSLIKMLPALYQSLPEITSLSEF